MMRVNDAELADIDTRRGDYDRGEFLRMSLFGMKQARPRPMTMIPELNQSAWLELSRSATNLNQISRHLNEAGIQSGDLPQIIILLTQFRDALIGARLAEEHDDES
jgi:Bacterial mobilisation protein (MobC).